MITVYPRWRGEHFLCPELHLLFRGLSPLARGTLVPGSGFKPLSRFIPAGAGNTEMLPEVKPETAVYPRWRGEHGFPFTDEIECDGLSPLARGTLTFALFPLVAQRFIPAGAGNTGLLSDGI